MASYRGMRTNEYLGMGSPASQHSPITITLVNLLVMHTLHRGRKDNCNCM